MDRRGYGSSSSGRSLSEFPMLEIRGDDIHGSWKRWYDEFMLAVEYKEMTLEDVREGGETVRRPVFRDRKKVIALLRAIGEDGREALRSQGFDFQDRDASYDDAMRLLRRHYCREDTLFVKTQKFVTVRQMLGEDNRDFLLRVERLSREICGTASANQAVVDEVAVIRERLCLALAVTGLRNSGVRNELMSIVDLTWSNLYTKLAAHSRASESAAVLDRNKSGTSSGSSNSVDISIVKQEVAYTQSRSSDSSRDFYCSNCGKKGHSVRVCRDAICYRCGVRGHISRDCNANLEEQGNRRDFNGSGRSDSFR